MSRLLFVIGLMAMSCYIHGQNEELKDSLIPELIITPFKYPVDRNSSWKPTTIIEEEEIQRAVHNDLSVLLDQQAGIGVAGALSNPGKDKSLFLQGAGGEYTLILIDGIPVTDPSGIGGSFDIRNIALNQIERIEIVKGGLSALYGSDAVAGVINIITKNAHNLSNSRQLDLSYGTYKNRNASFSMTASTDQLGFILDASHTGSGGISEALDKNQAGFDNDAFHRNAIHTKLSCSFNNQTKVTAFQRYSAYDGDYDGGAFTDSDDTYQSRWLHAGLVSDFVVNGWNTQMSFAHHRTNRTFDSESFGQSDFKGRFDNLEIISQSPFSSFVDLSVGFNYQRHKMLDELAVQPNPSTYLVSPYVSMNVRPVEGLNAGMGFRLNHHGTFGTNTNISLGANWKLNESMRIHGGLASSFKAPNLFQLYGQFGANAALEPQTGRTWNLGLSWLTQNVWDVMEIGFFNRRVRQLIIFTFPDGYINTPVQNDHGLEWNLRKSLGRWTIDASYEYLFGEIDDQISTSRENLIRRPRHQFSFSGRFRFHDSDGIELSIRRTGTREDLFFDSNTFTTEAITLGSYWYASLNAEFSVNQDLRFTGQINNLLDSEFQEIAGFSTMGRNVLLGVQLDF